MSPRLSVGAGTGQKVAKLIFALFSVSLLAGVLTVAEPGIGLFEPDGASPGGGAAPAAPMLFGEMLVIVSLLLTAVFVAALVSALRQGATLEGSVLRVRGAFRTRRADLSTAKSWVESVMVRDGFGTLTTDRHRVPVLIAEGENGRVRLNLYGPRGSLLPSHELTALADAIGTPATADHLRHLANDSWMV